jgi:hypothetical protein
VVGAFQLRHFSEFGRRLRTGNGTFRFPCQNISRAIERALILPDVAGHTIDHRSDVFFLRGVVADGQDLLLGKIRYGAFDLRDEPEPADQAGAFDSPEFRRWLSRGHECLAFRLPFADKLLKQFVFFDRSGHFLAGGRILGRWFFCNSAHIFPFLLMVSPVRPVQRHDERPEMHRTPMCDFFGEVGASIRQKPNGTSFPRAG